MAATSRSRSRSGCSARCSASRNGEVDSRGREALHGLAAVVAQPGDRNGTGAGQDDRAHHLFRPPSVRLLTEVSVGPPALIEASRTAAVTTLCADRADELWATGKARSILRESPVRQGNSRKFLSVVGA